MVTIPAVFAPIDGFNKTDEDSSDLDAATVAVQTALDRLGIYSLFRQ